MREAGEVADEDSEKGEAGARFEYGKDADRPADRNDITVTQGEEGGAAHVHEAAEPDGVLNCVAGSPVEQGEAEHESDGPET